MIIMGKDSDLNQPKEETCKTEFGEVTQHTASFVLCPWSQDIASLVSVCGSTPGVLSNGEAHLCLGDHILIEGALLCRQS